MFRPLLAAVLLSLLTPSLFAQDDSPSPSLPANAERFLHWGDQGNGTYANPVLNGDFADADVEKHGDRWYLITSTNHLLPGMTILESKDLVNWRYTGHAFPSLSWEPQYGGDQMNGYQWGIWAGDLAWHEERQKWLCYQIDFQSGLYLSRAKDIHGPWSAWPECLLKRQHWTDPTVFFDGYRLFGVREENDGKHVLFFTDHESVTAGEEISPEVETICLRSDTDFDRATFSWNLDGETWKQTDQLYQLTFGSWRGNRPCLFCWNARTDDPTETGWMDVDWFKNSE